MLMLIFIALEAVVGVQAQDSCFTECQSVYTRTVETGYGAEARCNGLREFENCFSRCPGGARKLQQLQQEMRSRGNLNDPCHETDFSRERGGMGSTNFGHRSASNRLYEKSDFSNRRITETNDFRREHTSRDFINGGLTRDHNLGGTTGRRHIGGRRPLWANSGARNREFDTGIGFDRDNGFGRPRERETFGVRNRDLSREWNRDRSFGTSRETDFGLDAGFGRNRDFEMDRGFNRF